MADFVRKNAFNNGGNFTNDDLRWYAKGVEKMMSRRLDDPKSWWFFAAMHGEYVDPDTAWYADPRNKPSAAHAHDTREAFSRLLSAMVKAGVGRKRSRKPESRSTTSRLAKSGR